MNKCSAYRLTEIVVALAIILLLTLLVLLWGGSSGSLVQRPDNANLQGNKSSHEGQQQPLFQGNLLLLPQPRARDNDTQARKSTDEWQSKSSDLLENIDPTWGQWKGDILPSNAGDVEYVTIAKSPQNTYEDPHDGFLSYERHNSGHFRHSQSKVWDPHPQYDFVAFDHRFRIRLKEDRSFVRPGVTVTHVSDNSTRREYPDRHLGCFYTGYVEGDPKSVVAVSLCHGMTGHIKTSSGIYLIKPDTEHSASSELPLRHIIYRLSASNLNSHTKSNNQSANDVLNSNNVINGVRACGVIDDTSKESEAVFTVEDTSDVNREYESEPMIHARRHRRYVSLLPDKYDDSYEDEYEKSFAFEDDQESESSMYGSWRSRRALPREYFIEIMIVADATMIDYHGSNLTNYILVLMNTVSRIYKDPSIGNPISIALIEIKKIDKIFGLKHRGSDGIDAPGMLKKFCDWQNLYNPHEPHPEHHDTALLLTRENLCYTSGQKGCDTLGLAELGRMCSINSSCSIVQDNGLATAITIAHEIGHVLNMPHDDDHKCSRYSDRSTTNIMARMLDENTVPWEWSKCSRHYLTEFLEAGLGNCLLDEPGEGKIISRRRGSRLPGEDYSENKQCELVYGPGSVVCPHMENDVCKTLWCTKPFWDKLEDNCQTQHTPWADGTSCGKGKWCHRGECVSRENLEPVDGQWGEWSSYGECSRSCGGGIKKKVRHCDNPPPKNGGNYCVGERVRYKSCSTKDCPSGSLDFRERQCAEYDNDNRNIRNLTKNVKWHAKYDGILSEDRCKLYCQVASHQYYMLREKVVDGTPCGLNTFHVCVNGNCKPAGCDHVLNSTATLDICGVCRGDNSTCHRISGSYNVSEYGYIRVTKIPAGSSYIDIRQLGWNGSHDSNYLALKLEGTDKYILNGDFKVMQQKVIMHPGATIEYSGPEKVVERLNSSRPINVDLILEVLSVGDLDPPQITYEYTVPKKILDRYMWVLSDWTACDRMCQGVSYRKAQCRSTENQDVVPDDYCPLKDKPREESRKCNSHCELQWQEVPNSRSECSSHCGPGTLYVRHHCVQVSSYQGASSFAGSARRVPLHACHHLERPQELKPCVGACENAHWMYGEWSACSVTCGGNGFRSRQANCVDAENRTVSEDNCSRLAKIVTQTCGYKSCPTWTFGDWGPCSVSCGIGKRERPSWCLIDNRVVQPDQCKEQPARVSEVCDAGPCPTWHTSDWNPCSATCGDAVRKRMVICKYSNGTPSRDCDSATKPISSISCALAPCPVKPSVTPPTYSLNTSVYHVNQHENEIDNHRITFHSGYRWTIDGFEECSKSCGGGVARQIIKCISTESNKTAPNQKYCDLKQRPPDVISCNEHQCPNWKIGSWSQCDVKCGDGYQHRQILCQDPRGEIMNDSACSEKQRPRHARKCMNPACSTSSQSSESFQNFTRYKWRTGLWSECSKSCGDGVRRRDVSCHRVNIFGWLDPSPSYGCDHKDRPISEMFCKVRGCSDQFYWMPGAWKKCSQPCGRKGRQLRRLFCLDTNGRKVRRRHCPPSLRPPRKRKCNQRPCTGPTSCLDVQARLKSELDGEYTLLVGGRYMSIYCYGMDGRQPLEYLTLPTGERENYAEIYDRRLVNPQSCPYNGRRNDSCDCMDERLTISGRTMFSKVRIDVHNLRIVANDYRFAIKIGENNIEYGKAGDCYSRMDCPQGRFGINLSGTYLMLSPDVSWQKQKNTFSIVSRINNQRVMGKCGGYCGFCTPFPGLKLNVLPP